MNKETFQFDPMMSELALRTWLKDRGLSSSAHNALQWMNAKISSGELRVVKKARILSEAGYDEWYQPPNVCSDCGFTWMCPGDDEGRPTSKLCPNCGADLTQ